MKIIANSIILIVGILGIAAFARGKEIPKEIMDKFAVVAEAYDSNDFRGAAEGVGPLSQLLLEADFTGIEDEAFSIIRQAAGVCSELRLLSIGEKLYKKMLNIAPPGSLDKAAMLNDLGLLKQYQGDYTSAEHYYLEALTIREVKAPGEGATATTLDNLGEIYRYQGEYQKARAYYQKAEALYLQIPDDPHLGLAYNLNNQGELLRTLGQLSEARNLYERALKIFMDNLDEEKMEVLTVRGNIALADLYLGDVESAISNFTSLLATVRKSLPPGHPIIVRYLNNLGAAYDVESNEMPLEERNKIRLKFYVDALNEALKATDPDPMLVSEVMGNVGFLAMINGDLSEAKKLLQQSLQIERRIPNFRYEAVQNLEGLGRVALRQNDRTAAMAYAQELSQMIEKKLKMVLTIGSTAERLSFASGSDCISLAANVGDGPSVAKAVLLKKGVVLDAMLEEQQLAAASTQSDFRDKVVELRKARYALSNQSQQPAEDLPPQEAIEQRKSFEAAYAGVVRIEREIAQTFSSLGLARRCLEIKPADIAGELSQEEGMIEYVTYRHFDAEGRDTQDPLHYGAVVYMRERPVQWVPLGPAEAIDVLIRDARRCIEGNDDEDKLKTALQAAYKLLWTPIAKEIPEKISKIVFSPDGAINLLPMGILMGNDSKLLMHKFLISYQGTARDVMRPLRVENSKNVRVVSSPRFALGRPAKKEDILKPLPGSAAEGNAIAKLLTQRKWQVTRLDDAAATEAAVRSQEGAPVVLHFATHSYYHPLENLMNNSPRGVPDAGASQRATSTSVATLNAGEDGMRRSWIALAGAQDTIDLWAAGAQPKADNDGILNAEEVASLPMSDVQLVVLSGCDSGLGDVERGEGVFGLRRAFLANGTAALASSLWKVPDEGTDQLMTAFYLRLISGLSPADAMAETQRELVTSIRYDKGLLAAIRSVTAFIVVTNGKFREH